MSNPLETLFDEAKGLVRPAVTDGDVSLPHALDLSTRRDEIDEVLAYIAQEPKVARKRKLMGALAQEIQGLKLHPGNAIEVIRDIVGSMLRNGHRGLGPYIAQGVQRYLQRQGPAEFTQLYQSVQQNKDNQRIDQMIFSFIRPGQVGLAAEDLVRKCKKSDLPVKDIPPVMQTFVSLATCAAGTPDHRDAILPETLTQAFDTIHRLIANPEKAEGSLLPVYVRLYELYGYRARDIYTDVVDPPNLLINLRNLNGNTFRICFPKYKTDELLLRLAASAAAFNHDKDFKRDCVRFVSQAAYRTIQAGPDESTLSRVLPLLTCFNYRHEYVSAVAEGVGKAAAELIQDHEFDPLLRLTDMVAKAKEGSPHFCTEGFLDKLRTSWQQGLEAPINKEAFLRFSAAQASNPLMSNLIDTTRTFVVGPKRAKGRRVTGAQEGNTPRPNS